MSENNFSSSIQKPYFEKYFDTTYNRPYYYNPATGDSLWEVPTDSIIADLTPQPVTTITATQQLDVKPSKETMKKQLQEDKRREEYRKRQAEIEKLQNENLQAMYPEYYAAHQNSSESV